MKISYNWLHEYLPVKVDPERLSKILTSVGLEVESLEKYESVKGALKGLVVGKVLKCEKHPNADKLKLTLVDIGGTEPLSIVCGAPNVAKGQKVVVARIGTTIYPLKGEPLTMKVATIRGIESQGMICAEDEIGLGEDHQGIMILPDGTQIGSAVADLIRPYEDYIYEIGLTPNHMDAMSHIGVARDICAFLSHHGNKDLRLKQPDAPNFQASGTGIPIIVTIQNIIACQRYSGLVIDNVRIEPSPSWMQDKLKAIGVRPINNIVDITNYVLHETGQPLHAFDAQEIIGNQIIIRNLPEGTPFRTLDEKDRKLSIEDLMICNAESGMCIAGVFGGLESGIKSTTTRIFLESAWFNPIDIRKTSFRHGLRTDAATHFEKGMDISNTVFALKRTAALILELKAGEIASEIIDVYPHPKPMTVIVLKYHYLNKLSGKNYHPDSVKNILQSLGFGIIKEGLDDLHISVPYHKPDITLPADVVEEVMRIDGLDNIPIPGSITISPSVEPDHASSSFREKVSDYLVGLGFQEIFTNSITSSAYYEEAELKGSVHMINNLSADLDILRPCMLETGLETLSYNLNRKMGDLRFFDFGKTYQSNQVGVYSEKNHFTLYITGALSEESWKRKPEPADIYYLKGVCERVALLLSPVPLFFERSDKKSLEPALTGKLQNLSLLHFGSVSASVLKRFDIRQPVYFADFDWDLLLSVAGPGIEFREIPKQLPVIRDLAIVVDKGLSYQKVELTIRGNGLSRLRNTRLFDVFENPRLGENKKSLAISFSFWDEDKTLTDEEVDSMMQKIMQSFEKELSAEIRK